MKNITYEVVKEVATLSETENGYEKRVTVICWNGGRPQLDIRMWKKNKDDTQKPLKGISLSSDETMNLIKAIKSIKKLDFNELEHGGAENELEIKKND